MLKTLSAYIGEYKRVSIKTPIYIIVEVLMEILIPFVRQVLSIRVFRRET